MILNSFSDFWPSSNALSSVAPQLWNHLWQSTLFAVAVALLAFTLRRYPARIRYWLWMTASAKFLIPFSAAHRCRRALRSSSCPRALHNHCLRSHR